MKKKVIVIGGGIAGLSAGVYAQNCGFDVTVLESHSIPGGNCTSWRRGGYLFEGGMHWLTGSDPKQPLNKCWRYVGALNDDVAIHCPEPFTEYIHDGQAIRMYRDVEQTEKQLLEISPEDEAAIKTLCGYIRKVRGLSMPVTDIRGVKVTKKQRPPFEMLTAGVGALSLMAKMKRTSRQEFLNSFKHEGIRKMLEANTSESSGFFPLVFSMGIISSGDGGFPEGGSLPFVERIAEKFKALGGDLRLNTRAESVAVIENRAVGVYTEGKLLAAHAVIVTVDTMTADSLFKQRLESPWLNRMRQVTLPTMVTFVSLGIDADLSSYNKGVEFGLKTPIKLGKKTYETLSMNNYAGDASFSPKGKSAVTVMLEGDTYDFWKNAKKTGTYADEKRRVCDEVIAAIAEQFPETAGKVEVRDVATPLTYERYCGTWKGSWMTDMTAKTNPMKGYPATIKGLEGVYFAGQRMSPPGGLPLALSTGRTAVQHLCRDTKTVFISEE